MSSAHIAPVKCALKYQPPTLVLFYKDLNTGKNRRRSIPLRGFKSQTSVPSYSAQLHQNTHHAVYISAIPSAQLESLLQRVKDSLAQSSIKTPIIDTPQFDRELDKLLLKAGRDNAKVMPENDHHRDSVVRTLPALNPQSPLVRTLPALNPQSPLVRTLPALNPLTGIHKENILENQPKDKGEQITTNQTVLLGQLRTELPPLQIEKGKTPLTTTFPTEVPDSSDSGYLRGGRELALREEEESLSFHMEEILSDGSLSEGQSAEEGDDFRNIGIVTQSDGLSDEEDLNKATDEELAGRKAVMDLLFNANQLKLGDPGYEYDREVDYSGQAKIESGWDSDSASDF